VPNGICLYDTLESPTLGGMREGRLSCYKQYYELRLGEYLLAPILHSYWIQDGGLIRKVARPKYACTAGYWRPANTMPEIFENGDSLWKRIKNGRTTCHFGFVLEENSVRVITWVSWLPISFSIACVAVFSVSFQASGSHARARGQRCYGFKNSNITISWRHQLDGFRFTFYCVTVKTIYYHMQTYRDKDTRKLFYNHLYNSNTQNCEDFIVSINRGNSI